MLEYYKKALEIDPNYSDVLYNLGVIYYNRSLEFQKGANNTSSRSKRKDLLNKAEESGVESISYFERFVSANLSENVENETVLRVLKELYFKTEDKNYKDLDAVKNMLTEKFNK